jgi:hypothetical protein
MSCGNEVYTDSIMSVIMRVHIVRVAHEKPLRRGSLVPVAGPCRQFIAVYPSVGLGDSGTSPADVLVAMTHPNHDIQCP